MFRSQRTSRNPNYPCYRRTKELLNENVSTILRQNPIKKKKERNREKEIRDCVVLTNNNPSKLQVGEIQEKERNEGNC